MQLEKLNKLALGYKIDQDRETVSLIFFSYFYILLFSAIVVLLHTSDEELLPVSSRYHGLILLGLLELLLIRYRLIFLAKLLLLTLTPVILLILPPLAGLTSDEFFFWFPYVPIALSLIPHFILHTEKDRIALGITLILYFFLGLLIDNYLIFFQDGSESIIPIILANKFYYNLIPAIIYIFVNLALGLVFARNHRYEQIMLKQQDELIHSEKMASLGTLTTGIAHEINNPMNFISGGIHATTTLKNELLKMEGELDDGKKDIYEQMDKIMENSLEGVQRVSEIITSLKFFANPGKAIKKDHDLDQLLYMALRSVDRQFPYNITVTKEVPAGTNIYCFDEQLQQVFINILLNAIQVLKDLEGEQKKSIDISVSKTRKEKRDVTCISFSNNGPPIPERELKKIYDPFFTMDSSGKGKGLGMAISYMIIREHQGWIVARNEQERVIFDVLLPDN